MELQPASSNKSLWLPAEKLILASKSETRRILLESASIPVEAFAANFDEREVEARSGQSDPHHIALRLAEAKADDVSIRHPSRIVLGADQILELDGRILHKAQNRREAEDHLRLLSGRTHVLHSAAAISRTGKVLHAVRDSAFMTMRDLDDRAISTYLDMAWDDDVVSSVGVYRLERHGIHLFSEINGHHSTILGLPLLEIVLLFRQMNVLAF